MPQSLSRVLVHAVFSTKYREPVLTQSFRDELHAYLGGVLLHHECPPLAVGGVEDHVHLLFGISRVLSIASVMEIVKVSSSKWLKTVDDSLRRFHWQGGYGAFSVSESKAASVVRYIRNQEQHHRRQTFQDELRQYYREHKIEFHERHVWD